MYFRGGVSHKTFQKLDHYTWQRVWKWAKFRHPTKGHRWIYDRYYRTLENRNWVFVSEDSRGRPLKLARFANIRIIRHIKVAGTSSPDDPEQKAYWIKRHRQSNPEIGIRAALFNDQKGICPACEDWLNANDEQTEVHHKDGNHRNNQWSNLVLLHSVCHKQVTSMERRRA